MRIQFTFILTLFCLLATAQVTFGEKKIFGFAYEMGVDIEYPTITEVIAGSPAYFAGLKVNDKLLAINNQSLKNLPMETVVTIFSAAPSQNNSLQLETIEGNQHTKLLGKAAFIAAAYYGHNCTIFLNERNQPLTVADERCLTPNADCYNGFGYYVYDTTQAFYGFYENGDRKAGFYYYVQDDKPCYYLGEFVQNDFSGTGILRYISVEQEDLIYTGEFLNGKANGQGIVTNLDGSLAYSGGYKDWQYYGYGKRILADGTVAEGEWINGVLQNTQTTQTAAIIDNSGYTAEEIAQADQMRKRGLTEEEIRKYFNYINAPPSNPYPTDGSNTTKSALDEYEELLVTFNNETGLRLLESFDVSFSKYQVGTCFTSCSEYRRNIYLIVEDNLKNLIISPLVLSSSIIDSDNNFPFKFLENNSGYTLYYNNMITESISTGCSYQWRLISDDADLHYARVLVFTNK